MSHAQTRIEDPKVATCAACRRRRKPAYLSPLRLPKFGLYALCGFCYDDGYRLGPRNVVYREEPPTIDERRRNWSQDLYDLGWNMDYQLVIAVENGKVSATLKKIDFRETTQLATVKKVDSIDDAMEAIVKQLQERKTAV